MRLHDWTRHGPLLLLVLALVGLVLLSRSYANVSEVSGADVNAGGDPLYLPGTYTAQAEGYGGAVSVSITVSRTSLLSVRIEGLRETHSKGGRAIVRLARQLLSS